MWAFPHAHGMRRRASRAISLGGRIARQMAPTDAPSGFSHGGADGLAGVGMDPLRRTAGAAACEPSHHTMRALLRLLFAV